MARVPPAEIGMWIADKIGGSQFRVAQVPADAMTFAAELQGPMRYAVEGPLRRIATEAGTDVKQTQYSPGSVGGKVGPPVFNMRWSARKGVAPGFTVALRHNTKRVSQVFLVGRVTTPWAVLAGLLLGAALEYLWYPWFAPNYLRWGSGFSSIYIVGILVSTAFIYWVLVKITNTVFISIIILGLCVGASILLSFFWGFVFGLLIGWTVVTRGVAAGGGASVKYNLTKALDDAVGALAMVSPVRYTGGSVPPFPGGLVPVGYGGPPMAAMVQPPGYASPVMVPVAPPPPPRPRLVTPPPQPAATRSAPYMQLAPASYPCPTCGAALADGAARCGSCNTDIIWG